MRPAAACLGTAMHGALMTLHCEKVPASESSRAEGCGGAPCWLLSCRRRRPGQRRLESSLAGIATSVLPVQSARALPHCTLASVPARAQDLLPCGTVEGGAGKPTSNCNNRCGASKHRSTRAPALSECRRRRRCLRRPLPPPVVGGAGLLGFYHAGPAPSLRLQGAR